jgi:hypothetical protein
MQIVDLILAVCMISDPQRCRDEHLYFESHGSLRACMWEAVPTIAQWSGEHPQWQVKRFRCEWADGEGEKT